MVGAMHDGREAPDQAPGVSDPQPRATAGEGTPADLGLLQVIRDDGSIDPETDPHAPPAVVLRAYREIKRLRLIDARMILQQRQGRVGFYGACTGQEATPVATALTLEPEDWVFPALRESSIMLARGFPLTTYLAQVYGNAGDILKGRQMPSHMSGRSVNQVSWSSCIGTQIPQAVGAAWAAKHRGDRAISVGFLGDGATSEPDFHNAMNFAGVFRVPCVMICQNNHWAISVPSSRQTASNTSQAPARLAVCERADFTPAWVRPVFTTSTGLPARRAAARLRRKRTPSSKPST